MDGWAPVSDEQRARLERDEWSRRLGREPYPHLVTTVLRFRGELDADALTAALATVRGRHEALQMRFRRTDDGWDQSVRPGSFAVRHVDVSEAGEEALSALAIESGHELLDVGTGTPLRAALVRLGERDHALVLTIEHLVCDGWSVGVLVRELGAAYEAGLRGEEPSLPAPAVQFPDFVHWQHERLQGALLEELLGFWRERLGDRDPAPSYRFPFARAAKPDERRQRGLTEAADVDPRVAADLAETCRRRRVTPFMAYAAALQALVHRYTDERRIVLPAPVAGRDRPGTEDSVGWYATRLPLILDVEPSATGSDLLAQAQTFAVEAYDRQELPYARLVRELQRSAHPDEPPPYDSDVTINYVPAELMGGLRDLAFGPLSVQQSEPPLFAARSTLALSLTGEPPELQAALRYDAAEVDAQTARRVLDDYAAALAWLAREPERPVAELRTTASTRHAAPRRPR